MHLGSAGYAAMARGAGVLFEGQWYGEGGKEGGAVQ